MAEDAGAGIARVSVIIATRNRSALLAEALSSVQALEGPDLALEVIVADDDSTDDTPAVVAAFGARWLPVPALGAAAARNVALRAATGEFVAFLDDDDVWLPGHLRPQLALLRARPDLGGAIGQVVNANMSLTSRSAPWPPSLPHEGDVFEAFLELCPQLGATVIRAAVLETVGLFDEGLFGDEDWDWHLRVALGHRIGFVPVPCVLYRVRPAGTRDDVDWTRSRYVRTVYWTNVRRAWRRRPPLGFVARTYLRHRGRYAGDFLASAGQQAAAGQRRAAYRALRRALHFSPLHVLWSLCRDAKTRAALRRALLPSLVASLGPGQGRPAGRGLNRFSTPGTRPRHDADLRFPPECLCHPRRSPVLTDGSLRGADGRHNSR